MDRFAPANSKVYRAEVAYRDECWLRVMNGPDGKIVFAQQVTSGTCLEMPVIVDVDNDGHADIVVPSDNVQGNTHCQAQPEGQTGQNFTGSTEGTFVLTDPMNRCIKSDPRMPNPQSICTTKTANPLAPVMVVPGTSTLRLYAAGPTIRRSSRRSSPDRD